MAIQKQLIAVLQLLLIALVFEIANGKGLDLGFYRYTCPRVEAIVRKTTANYIHRDPSLAAGLLRMHFHDCFVRVRAVTSTTFYLILITLFCDLLPILCH